MATALSAQEIAKKWSENTIRNKATWLAGINGVRGNPMTKAAAAVDKYADGCQAAALDGTFVKGCQRVSEAQWKAACGDKGFKNIDTGVRQGESKLAAYLEQAMPSIKALSDRIQQMPSRSDADMYDRIRANIEGMRAIAAQRRG